jgi:hypothetical protein
MSKEARIYNLLYSILAQLVEALCCKLKGSNPRRHDGKPATNRLLQLIPVENLAAFRKANESLACTDRTGQFLQTCIVTSHKQIQILSLLSMNKCIGKAVPVPWRRMGEWSTSHPCRFAPGERAPVTHWIEIGWTPE